VRGPLRPEPKLDVEEHEPVLTDQEGSMNRIRRIAVIAVAMSVLALMAAPSASAGIQSTAATYEITITNLTHGQWLTPPAAALSTPRFQPYLVGRQASEGIQQIAENGNLAPYTDALSTNPQVFDWTVAIADPELPPIGPGQTVTFTLEGPALARFSFVSMLICTNDGFTGLNGANLPRGVGNSVTLMGRAYDAGTEINTESWGDLVPPCAPLTGFGDQGGIAVSDPDLAQHGVVRPHRGIKGIADLVPAVHGWHGPVSKIRITRVG
jgi:hypothetical protein